MIGSSNKGDIILDPFFGTGTTGAVAKKLGKIYWYEKDKQYIEVAKKRIVEISPHDELSLKLQKVKELCKKFHLVL